MTNYVERCLIVPSAYVQLARALCAGIAGGESGKDMLLTPLSPSGKLPATHYISQGMIDEKFAELLPFTSFDEDGSPIVKPGQIDTIAALAQGKVTLAQITALIQAIDVTDQDAMGAMDRLGLKLIQREVS